MPYQHHPDDEHDDDYEARRRALIDTGLTPQAAAAKAHLAPRDAAEPLPKPTAGQIAEGRTSFREYFLRARLPQDTVTPPKYTRQQVLGWNESARRASLNEVRVYFPGGFVNDVNDTPNAMSLPDITVTNDSLPTYVSAAALRVFGLTPDQVPYLTVIPDTD